MSGRRALTLVEVLAATAALLALLAATCVPVLRQAVDALRHTEQAFEHLELATLADALLRDPTAFGAATLGSGTELELAWPEDPTRPPIVVRRIESTETGSEADHAWLIVSCAELVVCRWMPIDQTPEGESSEGESP